MWMFRKEIWIFSENFFLVRVGFNQSFADACTLWGSVKRRDPIEFRLSRRALSTMPLPVISGRGVARHRPACYNVPLRLAVRERLQEAGSSSVLPYGQHRAYRHWSLRPTTIFRIAYYVRSFIHASASLTRATTWFLSLAFLSFPPFPPLSLSYSLPFSPPTSLSPLSRACSRSLSSSREASPAILLAARVADKRGRATESPAPYQRHLRATSHPTLPRNLLIGRESFRFLFFFHVDWNSYTSDPFSFMDLTLSLLTTAMLNCLSQRLISIYTWPL